MHKLFVSGFPLEISEIELAQLIAPHGDIATIKIVRDRKTRICKGYAFIEMQTLQDAANVAAALDGTPMGDRILTVNLNEEKPVAAPARPYRENKPVVRQNSGYSPLAPSDRPKRPRKQF